ncbi:GNAT family N-acetyltransferase [Fimbriimonas ginsengisoli]|uniref:N-acetyltransferase domain-containing protein n=1 Tax=Fimbriimonas ginsengisoli Gsoil 348 TaxID=661478 RepID=A0A068NQN8_FIMGI|nr:GNAT family N-acetyltransferase [Fimbriimonas ginsengisoli]AIE85751.1 hypothetical protein OP10G_2383 [Fimbriimonas ginsengisoli Gsoil 348]
MEIRKGIDPPGLSEFVSRAFLASPVFAGVDEVRYQPERIALSLAKGEALLAYDGGRLVGSVTLFPPDHASACEAFRTNPQVGLLAVDPNLGGRGIGAFLMDAIEREASANHEKLALSVTERGTALIAMYERRGYERVGSFTWPQAISPSLIMIRQL